MSGHFPTLLGLRNDGWSRILGWPGYRVYRNEIDEQAKTLKLWVRRKGGKFVCSGCGRAVSEIAEIYGRKVRDLPCFDHRTTVAVECICYGRYFSLSYGRTRPSGWVSTLWHWETSSQVS